MEGYSRLATFMAAYPEVAILRRFSALGLQRILYLQAELTNLEKSLRAMEDADKRSTSEARKDCDLDWLALRGFSDAENNVTKAKALSGNATEPTRRHCACCDTDVVQPPANKRWALVLEIGQKLNDYNEAVLQQAAMFRIEKPGSRDLFSLQDWMKNPGRGDIGLSGIDRNVWADPDLPDFLVLKARKHDSILSAWISNNAVQFMHKITNWIVSYTENRSDVGNLLRFWGPLRIHDA
ncbi:hypothetical protein GQ53DRAFT_128597 [Thozetella sp. PMI_491]|nr:hypothetical protein GQ53DRAFT_128597 [Thozetella sp. PMI_491]